MHRQPEDREEKKREDDASKDKDKFRYIDISIQYGGRWMLVHMCEAGCRWIFLHLQYIYTSTGRICMPCSVGRANPTTACQAGFTQRSTRCALASVVCIVLSVTGCKADRQCLPRARGGEANTAPPATLLRLLLKWIFQRFALKL